MSSQDQNFACTQCGGALQMEDENFTLVCNHTFCEPCMMKYLMEKKTKCKACSENEIQSPISNDLDSEQEYDILIDGPPKCHHHQQQIDCICLQCQKPVCPKCSVQDTHLDHPMEKFGAFIHESQTKIRILQQCHTKAKSSCQKLALILNGMLEERHSIMKEVCIFSEDKEPSFIENLEKNYIKLKNELLGEEQIPGFEPNDSIEYYFQLEDNFCEKFISECSSKTDWTYIKLLEKEESLFKQLLEDDEQNLSFKENEIFAEQNWIAIQSRFLEYLDINLDQRGQKQFDAENFYDALNVWMICFIIRQYRFNEEDNVLSAVLCIKIGDTFLKYGEIEKSILWYERVLEMDSSIITSQVLNITTILNRLGNAYFFTENIEYIVKFLNMMFEYSMMQIEPLLFKKITGMIQDNEKIRQVLFDKYIVLKEKNDLISHQKMQIILNLFLNAGVSSYKDAVIEALGEENQKKIKYLLEQQKSLENDSTTITGSRSPDEKHSVQSDQKSLENSQWYSENELEQIQNAIKNKLDVFKIIRKPCKKGFAKNADNLSQQTFFNIIRYQNGDIYQGECKLNSNIKHGKGMLTYKNGHIFQGEFVNDKKEGLGILFDSFGKKFQGYFKNDLREGFGTEYDPSLLLNSQNEEEFKLFEGYYIKGKRHGNGKQYFSNGDIFEGQFAHGLPNGKGCKKYANDNIYKGEWKDGYFDGEGILLKNTGEQYSGQWKRGMMHGKGRLEFSNDDLYEGNFFKDKMQGQGKLTTVDGQIFDGKFRDNKKDGVGKETFSNGNQYVGEYRFGKMHGKGNFFYGDGGKYEGEFRNGLKNGSGIETFYNQDKYQGQFKNDLFDGEGMYTFCNGGKYKGSFKDGKQHGQGVSIHKNGSKYEGTYKNGQRDGSGTFQTEDGKKYSVIYQEGKICKKYKI